MPVELQLYKNKNMPCRITTSNYRTCCWWLWPAILHQRIYKKGMKKSLALLDVICIDCRKVQPVNINRLHFSAAIFNLKLKLNLIVNDCCAFINNSRIKSKKYLQNMLSCRGAWWKVQHWSGQLIKVDRHPLTLPGKKWGRWR